MEPTQKHAEKHEGDAMELSSELGVVRESEVQDVAELRQMRPSGDEHVANLFDVGGENGSADDDDYDDGEAEDDGDVEIENENEIDGENNNDDDDEDDENENDNDERAGNFHPVQFLRFLEQQDMPDVRFFLLNLLHAQTRRADSHEELMERIFNRGSGILEEREMGNSQKVRNIMSKLPRSLFVLEKYRSRSNYDMPIDMNPDLETNLSAPHIYPKLLILMDLKPGLRVLDIGSGTGYLACCAANLVVPGGSVTGWEIHDRVKKYAEDILPGIAPIIGPDAADAITYITYDAYWPHLDCQFGAWDRIHIGAAISHPDKRRFWALLAPGGKLVSPVDDGLYLIEKTLNGEYVEKCVSLVTYRQLIKRTYPAWKPELTSMWPPHIRAEFFEVLKIWTLRPECPLSALPRELVFRIFTIMYPSEEQNLEISNSDEEKGNGHHRNGNGRVRNGRDHHLDGHDDEENDDNRGDDRNHEENEERRRDARRENGRHVARVAREVAEGDDML